MERRVYLSMITSLFVNFTCCLSISADDTDGGRIIKQLNSNLTATDRVNFISTMQGLTESFYTPSCESTYEAFLYLTGSQSLTPATLAMDTFSRAESRNEMFFAMFKPSNTVDWSGNIKGLQLNIDSSANGVLLDKDGNPATDINSGRISDTATTFWSPSNDGNNVEQGGVGGLLANRDPVSNPRKLYSNTGSGAGKILLQNFNDAYTNRAASGYIDDASLYSDFAVTDQASLTEMLNWARGLDVDDVDGDNSTTDLRPWILSDILHSQPLVVNYGARGGFSAADPDQRIFVGTNGGFMHMFGNSDGQEDWAFFPKELAPILAKRRNNAAATQHVYGIDAPASSYLLDKNGDGTIDSTLGDKAYLFFGLGRGGKLIYAMDVSNPDSPSFLWQIDNTSIGFSELGQTWSVPIVTTIGGYFDALTKEPKPVLIFGAGYDTNKDATGLVSPDSMGRGIYIIDAKDGSLVWSVTPSINTTKNLQETGLIHSVPANIRLMDSNGDRLTDRLYFADTGGNVWRIDMPGNSLPSSSQSLWQITKLANINGATPATDRRFFNAPDVVRSKSKICTKLATNGKCTVTNIVPFDAIMIGSGDRTRPNSMVVNDQFYMFRDLQINPYTNKAATDCSTSIDFRCILPINEKGLFDVSNNLIQNVIPADVNAATDALQLASGWLLNLQSAAGEKVLAPSVTLDGSVFFSTYTPSSVLLDSCTPLSGVGRLYQVNLVDAVAKRDFNNDSVLDPSLLLGSFIPSTASLHFGNDNKIRLLFQSGAGLTPIETGALMPQPSSIYWYKEEL